MIWVSLNAYCAALSRGHEPAEPGRDEFYRLGRAKRRTAESVSGSRGLPIARGANWGARSRRALALAGNACPQRAAAGPSQVCCPDARSTGPSRVLGTDKPRRPVVPGRRRDDRTCRIEGIAFAHAYARICMRFRDLEFCDTHTKISAPRRYRVVGARRANPGGRASNRETAG